MSPEESKILYQIQQKLNDMCLSNARDHKEIKIDINRAEDKLDNRVKPQLFYWVLAGVFLCLFVLGGYVYKIDNNLDQHISRAKTAFHQITGEEYVPPVDDFNKN
jgi:hypothetical protein